MNAVDTNVWVYAYDESEPAKRQMATELLHSLGAGGQTVSVWQVVSEFVNRLRRWESQHKMTNDQVAEVSGSMIEMFPVIAPERLTVLTALDLSRRYCLSHWDSMLLAACLEAGVTTLSSEDLSHGQRYDSVLVVNPFVV